MNRRLGMVLALAAGASAAPAPGPARAQYALPDVTPPTLRCVAPEDLREGDADRRLLVLVTDAQSGPRQPTLSLPVDTRTGGTRYVTVTARDKAGNVGSATCEFYIQPRAVLVCPGRPVVLFAPERRGDRVRLSGVVAEGFAGDLVALRAGGRTLRTVPSFIDGSFSGTVRAAAGARFVAAIDGQRSRAVSLEAVIEITEVGFDEVRGRIHARHPPRRLQVVRRTSCRSDRVVERVRVRRNGRFAALLDPPVPGTAYAAYVLRARVRGRVRETPPIRAL